MSVAPCPICQSRSVRPYRFALGDRGTIPLFACSSCHFMYVPVASDDHTRHASEYHAVHAAADDPVVATVNASTALFYWSNKLNWAAPTSILDIGCAEGRLLELGRCMGYRIAGIDVTDYYVERWRERGLRASVSTAEEHSRAHYRTYDAILARQVIEHVRDPVSFLDACAAMLKPGGACLIETGDPRSWQARLQGRKWAFWVPVEGAGAHVSFVPRSSATILGRRVGLTLRDALPHFRYRSLQSYLREKGRRWPDPVTIAKYLLHRTRLSGGRCYWYAADT